MKWWLVLFFFSCLIILFFYQTFSKGLVPFPGDLLLAEYQPWRSTSYNNYNAGSIPNKAQYFDTLRQLYPWKTFAIKTIKRNFFPLWNPYSFSGSPLFANFQSAILFPPNIFYLLFSQITAWTLLVVLQPFLSLVCVYILARNYKLSILAAIFSATSYGFCLYMTVFLEYNNINHFMYLLPLMMLAIEWMLKFKKFASLLLSFSVGISGFAGHAQLFAGVVFYSLLYGAIRSLQSNNNWTKRALFFVYILFFVFLGIGLSAIQWMPGIELITQSARSSHTADFFYDKLLIRPEQLILYFSPDIYGNPASKNYLLPFSYPSKALYIGITALFLAILSFFEKEKNEFWKALFSVTAVVSLFVFLNPVSFVFYKLNLPFVSTSSPSNYIFMISLGLCFLAGHGLDQLLKHKFRTIFLLLIMFWIILIGINIVNFVLHQQIIKNNLIYSYLILTSLTIILYISKINKKINALISVCLILISCLDLFYFFHKFNPFVTSSFVYPQSAVGNWLNKNTGIDRVWGYSYANIQANFSTQIGFYSPDGYDPLYPKSYGEFIQISNNGEIPKNFTDQFRSDAVVAEGFGQASLANNQYRLKILSILGVKYVLDKTENGSTSQTFPPNMFNKIKSINDFNIFIYKNAASRFFLTNSYRIYKTRKDFTDILFSKDFDPTKTILLDSNPHLNTNSQLNQKEVKLISYQGNSVIFKTKTDSPALLYLSDTYYPGWQAIVDNKLTSIFKADYAFRAIKIPKGSHEVQFLYAPKSFEYGLLSSIVSIIILIVLWISFPMKLIKKIYE